MELQVDCDIDTNVVSYANWTQQFGHVDFPIPVHPFKQDAWNTWQQPHGTDIACFFDPFSFGI